MRITGIISEYNPFHSGHAYHIQRTREQSDADAIVCIMTGEFTQRGFPAICDKWTRARMALLGGADVVIELPFLYAVQSAQGFAAGGVAILDQLGTNTLSFGAETPDLNLLAATATLLEEEPAQFKEQLRGALSKGLSYASAQREALYTVDPSLGAVLQTPNNLLAVEYLRAMERLGSHMVPMAVKREGMGHAQAQPYESADFWSSSAIRTVLEREKMPFSFLEMVGVPLPFTPVRPEDKLFVLVCGVLRNATPQVLSNVADMDSGLAPRIIEAARKARSWSELIDQIATRHYPKGRVMRTLLWILMKVSLHDLQDANQLHFPLYARVLGVRKMSKHVLSELSKRSKIPVSPLPAKLPDSLLTRFDEKASDMYGLLMEPVRAAGANYTTKLVQV